MDAQQTVLFDSKGKRVKIEADPLKSALGHCSVHRVGGLLAGYAVLYETEVPPTLEANVESLCVLSSRAAGTKELDAVAWPVKPLYADEGRRGFVGYTLRRPPTFGIPFDAVFRNPTICERLMPMNRRIAVLQSLCTVMDALHRMGRLIGHLDDRHIVKLEDKDAVGFISIDTLSDANAKANPAYLAPECAPTGGDSAASPAGFTRTSDYWALAVVVYRMLANGALPTYGTSEAAAPALSPVSASFPAYLTRQFERAFVEGASDPSARPSTRSWSEVLERYGKDLRQCGDCEAHWFWRWRVTCPYCAEEAARDGESRDSDPEKPAEPLCENVRKEVMTYLDECSRKEIVEIEGVSYKVLGSCRFRKDDCLEFGRHPFVTVDVGARWRILSLRKQNADDGARERSAAEDAWLLVDGRHGVCELLVPGQTMETMSLVDAGGLTLIDTDGQTREGMEVFNQFERYVADDGATAFNLIEKKTHNEHDGPIETIKLYTRFKGHRVDPEAIQVTGRPRPQHVPKELIEPSETTRQSSGDAGGAGKDGAGVGRRGNVLIALGIVACAIAALLVVGVTGGKTADEDAPTSYQELEPSRLARFYTLNDGDELHVGGPVAVRYGADIYGSYGWVDDVAEQVLDALGDSVREVGRDDKSRAVGILTDDQYVLIYSNAGMFGDHGNDADFTREDAVESLGSAGDMYEASVYKPEQYHTFVLCCRRNQAYRSDLRPYYASWRTYYWYRLFYRVAGWAQDSDGAIGSSSYEQYTGPTELP